MATRSRGACGLVVVSLAGLVGVAAWYGRAAWADSGAFALVLFGVPLACAALALWAESGSSTLLAPAVVTGCGAVSVGWSLVTGLGIGLGFLLPSLLLLVAATISWVDRGRDRARPLRG
ncbi:hypothetical protein [Blastococcus sp. VKM Ac-2987]|uniref:hypothetical protein n=1 Tax=Blastococcus sp. VKM Ac-2987 TaxID=3004141 RepID=UPI0022AB54E1|nr:hypothetical protein [Blastococcus sp. VKM Ac-2987]MCZ2861265.1 hypothetical protein [Blastococcus sp. VKM Ac-2987]